MTYLWIFGVVFLSSLAFWVQSRPPARSKPAPTRVVFQLVRDKDVSVAEAFHRGAVTLVRRLSGVGVPDAEIGGTPEEVSVAIPKGMTASELEELATAQPNLRIQTAQGWGPPQVGLPDSASIDTDIDDNWGLILFFEKPKARRLAALTTGPSTVVGLFLNERQVASQAIGTNFDQRCKLKFTGLGRPESGTRRQEGSGYDPPVALQHLEACLDEPLPAKVRIVKLREE